MEPLAALVEDVAARISIRAPEKLLSPPIIVLEGAAAGYEPGKPVLRNLNLRIDEDDRIGLLGPNGNGKSTFAKLLAERLQPQAGRVTRASKLRVAYFAQHQLDELVADESPVQHVRRLMPNATESQARGRAAEMGFSGAAADTLVTSLSGGEKARLLIGLAAFHGPHLLILDEPTNHLDIEAREALLAALNDFPGAVIVISHDRHLLDACVNRLWLVADGTVAPYDGDLDDYRARVLGGAGAARMAGKAKDTRNANGKALHKRIKAMETEIRKLEGEIAAMDKKLSEIAEGRPDPVEMTRLAKTRSATAIALAKIEEDWLEASAQSEELVGK
jgi:ATP-binding cassette subfamily F protein 3